MNFDEDGHPVQVTMHPYSTESMNSTQGMCSIDDAADAIRGMFEYMAQGKNNRAMCHRVLALIYCVHPSALEYKTQVQLARERGLSKYEFTREVGRVRDWFKGFQSGLMRPEATRRKMKQSKLRRK